MTETKSKFPVKKCRAEEERFGDVQSLRTDPLREERDLNNSENDF